MTNECTNPLTSYTRMRSSRMRTGRSLTVCWSLLPGGVSATGGSGPRGGVCYRGGLVPGVSAPGGGLVPGGWSRGGLLGGGISQHALRQTRPVDRQTPVKILPWPNFVAAGNNGSIRCDYMT